ncbi:MAG: hypothetical protein RLZZ444_1145 [Pseudomonadota bacterium]|jgi:hypothetical protein
MRVAAAISICAVLAVGSVVAYNRTLIWPELLWPQSAHAHIEEMASILRRMRAPASWCTPSRNPANIYVFDPKEQEQIFGSCLSLIEPASDFLETEPGHYVKRFYRAEVGDKFCEVTLSTVNDDERIVGSDCYFAFFPKVKDTGTGMTDDPFG